MLGIKGQHRSRHEKHDWAYQGLVYCGHCGGMLTAEVKKEQYIYCHCARHSTKQGCPERYVREEELEHQFNEAITALQMEASILEWVVTALKSSHVAARKFHEDALAKLEKESRTVRERLAALYVDKLDGKVSREVYEQLNGRWTVELEGLRAQLASHERADQSSYDEGAKLLEKVQKAVALYAQEGISEKSRLLNFVLSNSSWLNGILKLV